MPVAVVRLLGSSARGRGAHTYPRGGEVASSPRAGRSGRAGPAAFGEGRAAPARHAGACVQVATANAGTKQAAGHHRRACPSRSFDYFPA